VNKLARLIKTMLLVCVLVQAACSDSFEPYNSLKNFRVLAVMANPPTVREATAVTAQALVFNPAGESNVSFQWSWCPLTQGSQTGYACALSHAELQSMVSQFAPGVVVPDYDLGTNAEVSLPFPLPALALSGICTALQEQGAAAFANVIDCARGFPITLKVTATDGTQSAVAVKEVRLLFETQQQENTNPVVNALYIAPAGEPRENAQIITRDTVLQRNKSYTIFADVPGSSVETFTPQPTELEPNPTARQESLLLTWFAQGEAINSARTASIPDTTSFEAATINTLNTPLSDDFAESTLTIALVVRDGRGGVGWSMQRVGLAP
jgi:hypothetical protein